MAMRSNLQLYTPQDYQRQVHDGLASNWRGTTHVVKAVRQSGKSLMCQNVLQEKAINNMAQTSVYLAPTFKQCKEMFTGITKALKGIPVIYSSNASDLVIEYVTGSRVVFLSAEQGDNIRGYTVTKNGILIIDEAAYIKDEVFYAATPFVNANNAPILIVSTPRFKEGFFYEFYTDGEQGKPNVYAYNFTEYNNPYLSLERLEMYRRKMPVNLFRADYLGEWMEAVSELFGDFQKVLSNTFRHSSDTTAAIDWGVGKDAKSGDSDSTAISVMNEFKEQCFLKSWNDIDPTATIKELVKVLEQWHCSIVTVETNSIGMVYMNLLRNAIAASGINCMVQEFTTTNDSKRGIIEDLQVAIQNEQVQLLDNPTLKIQLTSYQMERTRTGKITYGDKL
jgi:hypothetical protein